MLGAFFILYPTARIRTLVLVFFVQIPAWVYLGGWFLYQLVEGHAGLTSASANGGGVAFFAHVGGFVFGALVTAPAQRGARRPADHNASIRPRAVLMIATETSFDAPRSYLVVTADDRLKAAEAVRSWPDGPPDLCITSPSDEARGTKQRSSLRETTCQ